MQRQDPPPPQKPTPVGYDGIVDLENVMATTNLLT